MIFILEHDFNFFLIEETYTITANELLIVTKLINQTYEAQYFYYGYHLFISLNGLTIDDMILNSNCNKLIKTTNEVLPCLSEKDDYN